MISLKILAVHTIINKNINYNRHKPVEARILGLDGGPPGDTMDTLVHFP